MAKIAQKNWQRAPLINRRHWQWKDDNPATQAGEWWQNAAIDQTPPWNCGDTDSSSMAMKSGYRLAGATLPAWPLR